jgi:hypothetical protein
LPVLLAFVLAVILLSRFWPSQAPSNAGNATEAVEDHAREHVSLSIDFGDGSTKDILDVAWSPGTTVADALSQVPALNVEKKGSGPGTLLTSIDGVANQGADGKNWTFSVNDQLADRSFAVYELHAGDRVLWTFGLQR